MELKTKTFLFILLAFLLGGVGGWYIGRTYFPRLPERHRPSWAEVQKQFADRLKLDHAQAVKVDSITEVFRQSFSQVQGQYMQLFHSKRDTLRMSIHALLSPEQKKLFDEYIKETGQREGRRREGGPERQPADSGRAERRRP
jgi:hypothetical protein